MTGGITATGEVTAVDEIRAKAITARETGKTVLLVPAKQNRNEMRGSASNRVDVYYRSFFPPLVFESVAAAGKALFCSTNR